MLALLTALCAGTPTATAAASTRPALCSAQVPTKPPPRNPWSPAKYSLAPAGPSAIRLCRYSERSDRLVRDALLTKEAGTRLVRAYQALQELPRSRGGFRSCPFYVDPIVEAHLLYPGGHSVVIFSPLGCMSASNGDITRAGPPKALHRLRRKLLHLTR